jgi:hypothetical protein
MVLIVLRSNEETKYKFLHENFPIIFFLNFAGSLLRRGLYFSLGAPGCVSANHSGREYCLLQLQHRNRGFENHSEYDVCLRIFRQADTPYKESNQVFITRFRNPKNENPLTSVVCDTVREDM